MDAERELRGVAIRARMTLEGRTAALVRRIEDAGAEDRATLGLPDPVRMTMAEVMRRVGEGLSQFAAAFRKGMGL